MGQLQRWLSLARPFFELDGEEDAIRKPFLSRQKTDFFYYLFYFILFATQQLQKTWEKKKKISGEETNRNYRSL